MASSQAAGRQSILEQAKRLFLAHGYHGVSIRDIVQACGLSNAALYYHFGSKQDLFLEVVKEYADKVARRVQAAAAGGGSCRARLVRMALAHVLFILETGSEVQILIRDLIPRDKDEIQGMPPEALLQGPALVAEVLEEGIAAGEIRPVDPYRAGVLLLGMINSMAARRMFDRTSGSLEADVEMAINILFEGIAA